MSTAAPPFTADRPCPATRADGTRREFVVGGGLTLGGLLIGCGGDDGPGASRRTSGFPVTVEHKYGSTRIPRQPRRPAAVGYTEQDSILALGLKPVLVREFYGGYRYATGPWALSALGRATPTVTANAELQFEKIAAARPDVILGTYSGMTRADYEKLSQIAPTVAQSRAYIDFGMPWQDQLRTIGRALGRPDRAQSVIADIDRRIASIRKQHPEFARRSVVLASTEKPGGDFYLFASQDPRVRLLTSLGFTVPAQMDRLAGKEYGAAVSRERSDILDADVLVFLLPENGRAGVTADPIFKRLDAVEAGRAILIDGLSETDVALNFSSPLSIPYALDQLVPQLAAALD